MKNLLGNMRRTIEDHEMIKDGDRVAVGLSGGKDSMALLTLLKRFQRFSPFSFHLEALTVDPGFNNFNTKGLQKYCDEIDVPLTVINTDIAKIVFDVRKEKNPCSLCANLRRGYLASAMNERDLNILALGHHQDDALSTFFMNMLYTGKLNTLEYKSYLTRKEIYVIRPLLNSPEALVIDYVAENNLSVYKSPCPVDKKTKREDVAKMLSNIYAEVPNSRKSMITSMRNKEQCNLFI